MAESDEHEAASGSRIRPGTRPDRANRRRVWVVVASVVCIAALAVPVAVALSSSGPTAKPAKTASIASHARSRRATSDLGPERHHEFWELQRQLRVRPAHSAHGHHDHDDAGAHVPRHRRLPEQRGSGGPQRGGAPGKPLRRGMHWKRRIDESSPEDSSVTTGHGTIDTDPFAMVAVSNVAGLGQITLRDNGTNVWEFGGADYGLAPGSSETGPGASLSGFAGLVEGTLGARQGALAMGGLSSPTGYLDLDQSMISGANQTGTGTVDGVAVTIYTISIAPGQGESIPGLNAEQAKAIADSDAILQATGLHGFDGAGLDRRLRVHSADPLGGAFLRRFHDEQRVDLLRLWLRRNGIDAGSNRSRCATCGVRVARHGRRPDDNDDIDGPTVHHCAVDDIATDDIHDRDRAAELDDIDDQRHPIDHDNRRPGSDRRHRVESGPAPTPIGSPFPGTGGPPTS